MPKKIHKIKLTANKRLSCPGYEPWPAYVSPSGCGLCSVGMHSRIYKLVEAHPKAGHDIVIHMRQLPDGTDGDHVIRIYRSFGALILQADPDGLDPSINPLGFGANYTIHASELLRDVRAIVPHGLSYWHVWVEAEWE